MPTLATKLIPHHTIKLSTVSLLCALVLTTETAVAEDSPSPTALQRAEQAYEQVDFEATHTEAKRALERGVGTPKDTSRIRILLGIAAAALGNPEEAREHFRVALAITPDLRLEKGLSPKIRSPYLEARGFWERQEARLALRVTASTNLEHLDLEVVDPTKLVKRIVLFHKLKGSASYQPTELVATETLRIPLPRAAKPRGVECFAYLLDEYGNQLSVLANSSFGPSDSNSRSYARPKNVSGKPVESVPMTGRWLPKVLAGAGLLALGSGVYFNIRRERFAREWNSADCELPGSSRINQCSDVNNDRRTAERWAITSYANSGALLAGSLVTWYLLSQPRRSDKASSGSDATLSCAVQSTPGNWISCAGRF